MSNTASKKPARCITEKKNVVGPSSTWHNPQKMKMEDVSENIIEMTKQISEVKLEGKYVRLNSRVLENWTVESHFGNVKLNTEFSGRSMEILEEYLFRIGQGISDFNT